MGKHTAMIVFSVLIVFLIGYAVYCYFALRNGYFPFKFYVVNPANLPPDAVQPNGNISFNPFNQQVYFNGLLNNNYKYSSDERQTIRNMATSIQQTACNWYCAYGKTNFPLPGGQSPIGFNTCVCS